MNIMELRTLLRGKKDGGYTGENGYGLWDRSFMRDYGAVLLRSEEESAYGTLVDGLEEEFTRISRILEDEKFHCREKFLAELRELFEVLEQEANRSARIFHRIAGGDVEKYLQLRRGYPDTIEKLVRVVYPNASQYAGYEVASAYYGYLAEQIGRMDLRMDELSERRSGLYRSVSGILEALTGENAKPVRMLDEAYERFILAIEKISESVYEEGVYSRVRFYRMS